MKPKKTAIVKPHRLRPGDTIGIVAPAGPFDPEPFEQGIGVLKSLGYAVKMPENIGQADGFLAGSDAHRAAAINACFADSGIQGIICARGGYGSMRILDLLDYQMIRKNPKPLTGFSDISALLWALYSRCSLVTFHGPVVTYLGKASQRTLGSLRKALSTDKPVRISAEAAVVLNSGRSTGAVCGGNLRTLCHLTGTPFAPHFEDCILVLEDVNEAPYRVDRMLVQMQMAECFQGLNGVALGSFKNCGDMDEILKVVQRVFRHMDIPVMAGFDIGHGHTNLTLPLGIRATLDTQSRSLIFSEPATRA